jgi:RimJ/RimL family protein N-acetyltransferase
MATLFETERLRVREIAGDDYEEMMAAYGDLEAMKYVGDGTALEAEDCARWIEITKKNYERRGYGMSCVVLKETGEVVGFCGMTHPGNQDDPELKYTFHRRFWKRGFATEAARGMLAHGAEKHRLTRIIATVDPAHKASHQVLEKCGLTFESKRRNGDGSETEVWATRV